MTIKNERDHHDDNTFAGNRTDNDQKKARTPSSMQFAICSFDTYVDMMMTTQPFDQRVAPISPRAISAAR